MNNIESNNHEARRATLMGNHKRVSQRAVMEVPQPEWTDTWHPVAHSTVIRALQTAVQSHGMEIASREYSLSKDGGNMFGVWNLNTISAGMRFAMIVRNSLVKMFGLGIGAGTNVMNCDNMSFSADYLEFRKHTGGLTIDEVYRIADRSIAQLIPKLTEYAGWHEKLKERELPAAHYKVLTFNAMKEGALAPSKFKEFNQAYDMEKQIDDVGDTVYTFHGAVTRTLRDASLFQVADRNKALNKVINEYTTLVDGM